MVLGSAAKVSAVSLRSRFLHRGPFARRKSKVARKELANTKSRIRPDWLVEITLVKIYLHATRLTITRGLQEARYGI